MSRLLTGYAIYYNKVHHRVGHLFQNRYKSILCDRDEYMLPLIRYIHLNPVRARKINFGFLEKYLWTGHVEIIKENQNYKIIKREEVLGYFGGKKTTALSNYLAYVREGLEMKEDYSGGGLIRSAGGLQAIMDRRKDAREMSDERILGDGSFIKMAYKILDKEDKIKDTVHDRASLMKKISNYYNVDFEELKNIRNKNVRKGRSVAIYLLSKYCHQTITEAGALFGIKQSGASSAMRRGKDLCVKEKIEEVLFN